MVFDFRDIGRDAVQPDPHRRSRRSRSAYRLAALLVGCACALGCTGLRTTTIHSVTGVAIDGDRVVIAGTVIRYEGPVAVEAQPYVRVCSLTETNEVDECTDVEAGLAPVVTTAPPARPTGAGGQIQSM